MKIGDHMIPMIRMHNKHHFTNSIVNYGEMNKFSSQIFDLQSDPTYETFGDIFVKVYFTDLC